MAPDTAAWQTLTEAVEEAERADPAVAAAAARFDAAIDDLNYQAALRRFRPLPWDAPVVTARHLPSRDTLARATLLDKP